MHKVIVFLLSLIITTISFAQTKVDCGSSSYSYNANVKRSCEQFQQTTQNARNNLQNKISDSLLKVKNTAPANTTKTSAPAAPASQETTTPETTTEAAPAQSTSTTPAAPAPSTSAPASSQTKSQPGSAFKYY